jgi:hypothetical protein
MGTAERGAAGPVPAHALTSQAWADSFDGAVSLAAAKTATVPLEAIRNTLRPADDPAHPMAAIGTFELWLETATTLNAILDHATQPTSPALPSGYTRISQRKEAFMHHSMPLNSNTSVSA